MKGKILKHGMIPVAEIHDPVLKRIVMMVNENFGSVAKKVSELEKNGMEVKNG